MPEVLPEAVTVVGAPLVVFFVDALRGVLGERVQARFAVLLTAAVGVGVAALIYAAGLVDLGDGGPLAIGARVVLAGLGLALAASGARSWVTVAGPAR